MKLSSSLFVVISFTQFALVAAGSTAFASGDFGTSAPSTMSDTEGVGVTPIAFTPSQTLAQSCDEIVATDPDRRYEAGASSPPARLRDPSLLRGVALVIHGLNHDQASMWNVRRLLLERGVESVAITLAGHGANRNRMRNVSREQWLANAYAGFCQVRRLAQERGVAVLNAGFSAGALIFEDLVNLDTPTPVETDRSVYFSPAFRTKSYVDQARHLYWLGGNAIVLDGLKLGAVRALLHSKRHVGVVTRYKRSNRQVEVFIDPRDPLVSYRGVENLIREVGLSGWRLNPVKSTKRGLEHVTVYESWLDDASRAVLIRRLNHLLGSPISSPN